MPSALLQYGFLKDGLALACVYHVIYFRLCWLPACYNVRSSLYHLPAVLAAVIACTSKGVFSCVTQPPLPTEVTH